MLTKNRPQVQYSASRKIRFHIRILSCPLSFDTHNVGLLADKGLFFIEKEAVKKKKRQLPILISLVVCIPKHNKRKIT